MKELKGSLPPKSMGSKICMPSLPHTKKFKTGWRQDVVRMSRFTIHCNPNLLTFWCLPATSCHTGFLSSSCVLFFPIAWNSHTLTCLSRILSPPSSPGQCPPVLPTNLTSSGGPFLTNPQHQTTFSSTMCSTSWTNPTMVIIYSRKWSFSISLLYQAVKQQEDKDHICLVQSCFHRCYRLNWIPLKFVC